MRLIDADKLVEHAGLLCAEMGARGGGKSILTLAKTWLLSEVNHAPTIEAKPIVHAHWEEHREFYEDEGFEGYYYSCSNCDGTLYGDVEGFNFCHCCGAQMNESVKIPVISMEDVPKLAKEMEK